MITVIVLSIVAVVLYMLMWKTSTTHYEWTTMEALFNTGFTYVPATNNWVGVPPPGLTWDEVSKVTLPFITPMTFEKDLTACPECGRFLVEYLSDWWTFSDEDCKAIGVPIGSGQHDVQGNYCPKGHYTHLGWA